MKKVTARPTLSKRRIAHMLGKQTGLSNRAALDAVERLVDIIASEIAAGGRVEIANFLILEVQPKTRYILVSEADDELDPLNPAQETYYVLKCRPGKQLRQQLQRLAHTKGKVAARDKSSQ